jgi:hypothetical protein
MPLFEYGIRHALASNIPISDAMIARRSSRRIDAKNCDQRIIRTLETSAPAAIGRLGGTEGRYLGDLIKVYGTTRQVSALHRSFAKFDLGRRRSEVNSNAGFFFLDHSEELKFMNLYIDSLRNLDVLGTWGDAFTWAESIALEKSTIQVVPLAAISPWVESFPYLESSGSKTPWTRILDGMKVLVVSPFVNSISAQHSKLESCFKGIEYPRFKLTTIRAPMTFNYVANTQNNWFTNLENLIAQVKQVEFDVALVGAGAYSLPLVSAIKNIGKKAIHTGGGTQIFFGVMGNRWNNAPYVQKYVNDNWVKPSELEIPNSAEKIENACYW